MKIYIVIVFNFRADPIEFRIFRDCDNAYKFFHKVNSSNYENGWSVEIWEEDLSDTGEFEYVKTVETKCL